MQLRVCQCNCDNGIIFTQSSSYYVYDKIFVRKSFILLTSISFKKKVLSLIYWWYQKCHNYLNIVSIKGKSSLRLFDHNRIALARVGIESVRRLGAAWSFSESPPFNNSPRSLSAASALSELVAPPSLCN